MDLNLKEVLDEFVRQFNNHDAKWERRVADLEFAHAAQDTVVDQCFMALETPRIACDTAVIEQCLSVLESIRVKHINPELDDLVAALVPAVTDLGPWHPEIKALLDDLRLAVSTTSNMRRLCLSL